MKKFRLPKKFAEKWFDALLSGKYEQATGVLYDSNTNGYCCLGVACAIEYPLHYLKTDNIGYAGVIVKEYNQLKFNLHKIPKELQGKADDNELVDILTTKNDKGQSFEDIIEWIKNNVELYEKK